MKEFDLSRMVRPAILQMTAYTPILPFEVLSEQLGRVPGEIIKLDANENPYGPLPEAVEALAALETTHIYPDPEARALRVRLAEVHGVPPEHLLVGAGADELIDLIMRLFLDPGDLIIDCPPTFGMYSFDAQLAEAEVISVPRGAAFSLDLDAIEQAARKDRVKLVFIASPNNPDGGLLAPKDLDRLLALPVMVVLDEAYIEFSGAGSAMRRVPHTPNLIVLRTFSKSAGLAGLRIGYGAFPLDVIAHLWKMKQPYNINVAADAAARASLTHIDKLEERAARLVAERDRMRAGLDTLPFISTQPSHSNFVLCRVSGIEAGELKRILAEHYGILIRYFNKPGLQDAIRISAGKPEHTDALLTALNQIGADHGLT